MTTERDKTGRDELDLDAEHIRDLELDGDIEVVVGGKGKKNGGTAACQPPPK